MIIYNMRNRGPYEYDKFALNVLQISNQVNLNESFELKAINTNMNSLAASQNKINEIYTSIIGNSNSKGISERIYEKLFENGGF